MILFLGMSVLGFVLAFGSKMEFRNCVAAKKAAVRNGNEKAVNGWTIACMLNRVGFGLILAGPLGALLWRLLVVTVWR